MPAVCYEGFGSRATSGDATSLEIETKWIVQGTGDNEAARSLLLSTTPALLYDAGVIGMLARASWELEQSAPDQWSCTVKYVTPYGGTDNPFAETFSFDTSGETHKTTQSYGTTSYKVNSSDPAAPDIKGAIGVSKDGVEGVDVVVPSLKLQIMKPMPATNVTLGYLDTVARMTGTVNAYPWRGFEAEQVLFDGASGQSQTDGVVPITFSFRVGQNVEDATIAGKTGITKKAWDYGWIMYEDIEHPTAKKILKTPKWIFIEEVYERADFSALGLGA